MIPSYCSRILLQKRLSKDVDDFAACPRYADLYELGTPTSSKNDGVPDTGWPFISALGRLLAYKE